MVVDAKQKLSDVPSHQTFKTLAGKELKNLEQLLHNFKEMDTKTFSHHVTEHKNDFSLWVRNVVKDVNLADQIDETKDQLEMERIVRNRVIQLKEALDKYEDSFKKDEEKIEEEEQEVAEKKTVKFVHQQKEEDEAEEVDSLKYFLNKHLVGVAVGGVIGLVLGFILGRL